MIKKQPKKTHGLTGRRGNATKANPRNRKRTIRLTMAEDYAITMAADSLELSTAEYIRRKALL